MQQKTLKAKLNRTEVQLFRDLDEDFLYTYHVKPHEDVDRRDHKQPKEEFSNGSTVELQLRQHESHWAVV